MNNAERLLNLKGVRDTVNALLECLDDLENEITELDERINIIIADMGEEIALDQALQRKDE